MTTIYTGSNYGIISTLNSISGTVLSSAGVNGTFELVKNYTSGSILLKLTAGAPGGWIDLQIEYSNDGSGTVSSVETYRFLQATDTTALAPLYPPSPITLQFKPQGAYMRIKISNLSAVNVDYNIQTRYNNSADPETTDGVISSANSINKTAVTISSTLNGTYEDISECSLITILAVGTAASIPGDCTLRCIFSTDGTNEDRIVTYTIQDITANGATLATNSLTFNPAHTLLPIARYFKIQFINNSTVQLSTLRITTTYHNNKSKALTSRVTQALTDQYDTDTTRSILTGRTLGTQLPQGHYQNIGVQNQAIATYIRDPATAFGEVLTGQLTPQIQFDYSNGEPYEVQAPIYRNILAQTTYTYANGLLTISSTATGGAITNIIVTSSEYTKYKPGLGLDARFTTVFDSDNGAGINQYAGLFTPENSLTFGYFDTNGFCIRWGRGGIQQIVDIDITAGTSNGTQVSFSFGGTAVTTTGLTAGNTIAQGAAAIAAAINADPDLNSYGWTALYYKATDVATTYRVRAVRNYASVTNIAVTTSVAGGYTITTPNTVRAGGDTTYTYYPQSTWNIDTCLGTGSLQDRYNTNSSGFVLNPLLGNVYRIVFQYLGFGAITFYVENSTTGVFMPVHQIKYANTALVPSVTSPNYKLGFGIENTTTTPITISGASFSAFLQGQTIPAPLYRSYQNVIPANTANTAAQPLTISKANSRVIFGFRILGPKTSLNSSGTETITINRSNLFLNTFSAALNVTAANNANPQPSANIVFELVKNPTAFYTGDPSLLIPFKPTWTVYERDSTILVFNGAVRTSTSTGIGYTGGVNVFDLPLVENASQVINLQPLLINVSSDDIYIVTYNGNINSTVTSFDVMASVSYQINN
jgi:hypothetical protein